MSAGGTGEWRIELRRRIEYILNEPAPKKSVAREARKAEDAVVVGNAAELVACRVGGNHDWAFDWEAWNGAHHTTNWPRCQKCAVALLDFVDLRDRTELPRDKTPLFCAMMKVRHEWLLQAMIATIRQHGHPRYWIDSQNPPEYFLNLVDPEQALTIPGGSAGMMYPLFRMGGWKLWWMGGTERMRKAYDNAGDSSLELFWDEVGLGNDVWRT